MTIERRNPPEAPAAAEAEAFACRVSVRPAGPADAPAVARLLVELWKAERPQLLVGGEAATERFLIVQLLAEAGRRVRSYHVGVVDGTIVVVAALSTFDEPRPGFARKGVARDLVANVGLLNTLRLVPHIAQSLLLLLDEDEPATAYLGEVVVARDRRAAGCAAQVCNYIERESLERGCSAVVGQVLDDKLLPFWRQMGGEEVGRLPSGRIARRLAPSSVKVRAPLPRAPLEQRRASVRLEA